MSGAIITIAAHIRTLAVRYVLRAGGLQVVALGVLADLRVANWYGIGLMAPESLSDEELKGVGRLARPIIATPFASLSREFERVLQADDPVAEFAELPQIHRTSLKFTLLKERTVQLPRHIIENFRHEEDDLGQLWARDQLKASLSDAWWELEASNTNRKDDEKFKRIAA